jgi:hypothetical protein
MNFRTHTSLPWHLRIKILHAVNFCMSVSLGAILHEVRYIISKVTVPAHM